MKNIFSFGRNDDSIFFSILKVSTLLGNCRTFHSQASKFYIILKSQNYASGLYSSHQINSKSQFCWYQLLFKPSCEMKVICDKLKVICEEMKVIWAEIPQLRADSYNETHRNGSYLLAPTPLITGATSLVIFITKLKFYGKLILFSPKTNFCKYDTTAQLSCRVQNFVAIWWPRMKCTTKFPSNLDHDGNIVSEMSPWAHIWDCQTAAFHHLTNFFFSIK